MGLTSTSTGRPVEERDESQNYFRLEIDKDNYQFLKTTAKEKDVAVLSSALKLFFRELPQPLISIALSDEIRKAVFNEKGTQEVTDLIESR